MENTKNCGPLFKRFIVAAFALLAFTGSPAVAQTILSTTTLSAAVDSPSTTPNPGVQTRICLAAVTNVSANTNGLFIPVTGEYMAVASVDTTAKCVQVTRGAGPRPPMAIASGETVIITQSGSTANISPAGSCTRGVGQWARYSPIINLRTGEMNVCRASVWQNIVDYVSNATASIPPFTP